MGFGVMFFANDKTVLRSHEPDNGNSITLAVNQLDFDHLTIFGLPAPIVQAFLDYYGDPNEKRAAKVKETEQV